MSKLVLKFTNPTDEEYEVKYDGKVLDRVPAHGSIDLPTDIALANAKRLADIIVSGLGAWGDWNNKMDETIKSILGEAPRSVEAPAVEAEAPANPPLDDLDLPELKALATEKGIKFAKNASKAKLLELLAEPVEDEEAEDEFPE